MVTYRYLGSASTDANGIAKYNFTGSGAGEIDYIASLDNPITDGSIVSKTYKLWDTLFFDNAVEGSHKTVSTSSSTLASWFTHTDDIITVSYSSDGMTVTKVENSTEWRYFWYNDTAISTTTVGNRNTITTPSAIEFDVSAITGSIVVDFMDNASPSNHPTIEISQTGHYKIVCDGSTLSIYKGGTQIGSSVTFTGSNFRFGFSFNAQNESITFKDFKVYSY